MKVSLLLYETKMIIWKDKSMRLEILCQETWTKSKTVVIALHKEEIDKSSISIEVRLIRKDDSHELIRK